MYGGVKNHVAICLIITIKAVHKKSWIDWTKNACPENDIHAWPQNVPLDELYLFSGPDYSNWGFNQAAPDSRRDFNWHLMDVRKIPVNHDWNHPWHKTSAHAEHWAFLKYYTEILDSSLKLSMAEAQANPSLGGYDEEFANAVEDELLCAICQLPLEEPMLTKCGHRFCRQCLDEHFKRWVLVLWARSLTSGMLDFCCRTANCVNTNT